MFFKDQVILRGTVVKHNPKEKIDWFVDSKQKKREKKTKKRGKLTR